MVPPNTGPLVVAKLLLSGSSWLTASAVIETEGSGLQTPDLQMPSKPNGLLHASPSCAGSGTQLVPWHQLHSGQSATDPLAAGSPPQCQPAFSTPTPLLDRITCPSSLTTPVPMATNEPMSWSYEYISVTSRGLRPSTLGSVMGAGGLNIAPAG